MKRRIWLVLIVALILLAACGALDQNSDRSPAVPLQVCYSSLSGTQAVAMYAYEKGLFEKYDLNVELIYIDSGSKAVSAMIAGEVDFCQVAGSAVINAAGVGAPLRIIAGMYNTYVYSLMVIPGIETPADLIGQNVAISRPGSASDFAMRAALTGLGLVPDEDVIILGVGKQAERLSAMATGQVVGTLVSVPETVRARELGYHELLDMSSLNAPYQHTAIATSTRYLEGENRQIAIRFMQAISDAIVQMKADREGTIGVIAQYLLMDEQADRLALDEAYDVLIQNYLQAIPYPTLAGIDVGLTELAFENEQALELNPLDVVDISIVQELEQLGFFDDLQNP